MQVVFDAAQITLTLIILTYASYRDWKTREVSDRVWAVYAPIALGLSLANFLLYAPADLPFFGLSVGVTVGFALLLFYTSGFGGADSKAFMCIALSLPLFPPYKPLIDSGLSPLAQTVFPLTILTNSALIAASSGLIMLLLNVAQRARTGKPFFEGSLAQESASRKLVVLVTGTKFSIPTLREKYHAYPLEDITDETGEAPSKRKLLILPKDEEITPIMERLKAAAAAGKIGGKVWATPGLPYLIFVTVGIVLALTVGDVVWILVGRIFG